MTGQGAMATVDVVVQGAGVFGLSCAWAMAQRGARVAVIDPTGVGAGASGGPVGALAPHTPENWNEKKAFQLESLLLARAFWPGVEAASGRSTGYGALGRVQPVPDDKGLVFAKARAKGAKALWQGQATWSVLRTEDAPSDWLLPFSPTGWLIYDTLTARLAPLKACQALATAIEASRGLILREGSFPNVPRLDATGRAGLEALGKSVGRTVGTGVKGQAAMLRLSDATACPQVFADALHIVPHADGTVAIGSTSEREYDDPTATDSALDALIDKARGLCPALANAPVIGRWAGERPRARSRAPMLGPWPGRPDVYVANGGFKIGFGMAPLVAEVIADLILEGLDRIPDAFRVEASF